jgi:hypothetical protein
VEVAAPIGVGCLMVHGRATLAVLAAVLVAVGTGLLLFGRPTAATVSTPAAQFMTAYNRVAAALPQPALSDNSVTATGSLSALQTFRASLEAIRIPAPAQLQARALDVATSRVLSVSTPDLFTGGNWVHAQANTETAITALHDWYTAAAALARALGLSPLESVAYPTLIPLPLCTSAQLDVRVTTDPGQHIVPGQWVGPAYLVVPVSMSTAPVPGQSNNAGPSSERVLCQIDTSVTVTLVDATGRVVDAQGNPYRDRFDLPKDAYNPNMFPHEFNLAWSNWCGAPGNYSLRIEADGRTWMFSLAGLPLPTCRDRGAASTLVAAPVLINGQPT